jgi:hypothetical protein
MIILPTYRRRANMDRYLEACRACAVTEPHLLMIDRDDDSYRGMAVPINFDVTWLEPGSTSSSRLNAAFRAFPNEPYYGVMGDDIVPLTHQWDCTMAEYAGEWTIAYGDDGLQGEGLCTIPFIGGEFVRAWGKLAEEATKHWYSDNVWMDLGRVLGVLKYVPHVKFDHRHWVNKKAPMDDTYRRQPSAMADLCAYQKWATTDKRAAIEKIKLAMAGKCI